MKLIDTHAHLYWDLFRDDLDQVIARAKDAGLTYIINIGVDVAKSQEALAQAQKLSAKELQIFSSIAIHPEEVIKYPTDESIHADVNKLEEIFRSDPKTVVAVGECGLDFLPQRVPNPEVKQLQCQLFQAQIDLAKKLNLPLLVHCRDDRSQDPENSEAWDTILQMVGDHPTILHCYSGLLKTTHLALNSSNLIFSFAGNLTYPQNEYLRETVKLIPLERIVTETDCPFLPPQSKRGQRNEPANVLEILQTISQIKNLSLEETAEQIFKNINRLLSNTEANTLKVNP